MREPLVRLAGSLWLVMLVGSVLGGAQEEKRSSAAATTSPAITSQDLLNGLKNPSSWLTYSGDYSGQRHSPLKQITPENAHRLSAQWTFQTETMARGRGFEATPLIIDGVLYATGPNDFAWALDARTGRPFWRYRRDLPNNLTYGASVPVNRGFAVLADRLFMTTLDSHLVALDMKTGNVLWDIALADYKAGYSGTVPPLVVKDRLIVGSSGGDYPTRGFLDAYDPTNGKRIWRFNTVPGPGEPGSETWPSSPEQIARGGGTTWVVGSYDPELNTLYWGTGNPNPDYYGDDRKGDNLYTCSLIAIDPDTGQLKWYYQFTPHDLHDWDSNHVPVLADLTIAGQRHKVVMVANRNGFFYVLDRVTGKVLLGKPFTDTTWARELGPDGHPIVLNDGSKGCIPDNWGGTNFMPPSFDPALRLFFVTARETCATFVPEHQVIAPGRFSLSGTVRRDLDKAYGALRAIDATTGERRWEFKFQSPSFSGVLSTASGVVFDGDNEGNFMAFDSRTGKNLWHYQTGSPIWGGAPMTYMLDDRQYVVIGSGANITAFALPRE
jgi:alcohol dehydrogenase (cytochrome c)